MKAVILVGGFGTRLRPLTLTCPKPLVQFCNKSMVFHQIDALAAVGVTEVVLAVSYQPAELVAAVEEYTKAHPSVTITISVEDEPMGTAGPLAVARDKLNDGDPFFVLNSDVVCEFPFKLLLNFHKSHSGEGTILTTPVDDPSKYGVVLANKDGMIERFVEKPKDYVGNQINAGIYIFDPKILDRIPLKPTSIEREIFPKVAADNSLYAMRLPGFWMDVGQPHDFLTGQHMFLLQQREATPDALVSGSHISGNVLIHESAKVGRDCRIGPDVVIGPNVVVGDGVRIANSCLLDGVSVASNALIDGSIVGWRSRIGRWARLQNLSVLGECVTVKDEVILNGTKVLPHKSVAASIYQEGTIIM